MEGLKGTAIRSAVRNPGCPQAPVLSGARRHPAMARGYSCGWLRPRPPIPARTVTSGEPARRVAYGPVTTSWCRDPDLITRVIPLVYGTGSRHPPVRQTLPISARASCAQLREDMDLAGRPAIFTEGSAPWCGLAVTAICPLGLRPQRPVPGDVQGTGTLLRDDHPVRLPRHHRRQDFRPC